MEPLKNAFSPDLVHNLSSHVKRVYSAFDEDCFLKRVLAELERHELKTRAQLIADELARSLPASTAQRAEILRAVLHPDETGITELESNGTGMRGWAILPLTMVVGQHGLDDFDGSLALLKDMTKRFSSEFGIRYFLLEDQDRTLATLESWVDDANVHVRRLVSEGTRPRLPWAMRLPNLIADPSPMLPLLTRLRDDGEEYVRRSVANHLNDISKDHPDLIAALTGEWMREADDKRKKLLRHACRTLVKNGHEETLRAFGHEPASVRIEDFTATPGLIHLGESIAMSARIVSTSRKPQSLVIDYVIHFLKANGRHSGKVFKGIKAELAPGGAVTFQRQHAIRPITTRRYYPGIQRVSLRINGNDMGEACFKLVMPEAG